MGRTASAAQGLPTRTDGGAEIKYDGATTHRVVASELEHRKRERGSPNYTSCITACVDCLNSTQVEFFVIQEEGEKYINSIITLHAEVLPVVNAIVDDLRTIGLASGTLQLVWTLSSSSSLALSSSTSLSSSLASSSSSKSVPAFLCTSSGSCASHVVPLDQPPVSAPRNGVSQRKSSETPLRASARIMTRKRRREEAEATTPKGDKERGGSGKVGHIVGGTALTTRRRGPKKRQTSTGRNAHMQ
ncbi:hypothetical protein QOT17_013284 [Balamuthia mandrillaris]